MVCLPIQKSRTTLGISLILITTIVSAEATELMPETNQSHCEAFGGTWFQPCLRLHPSLPAYAGGLGGLPPPGCAEWGNYRCVDRLEYQQKAVQSSNDKFGTEQFCKNRGGEWIRKNRGYLCDRPASKQGLQRHQLPTALLADQSAYQSVLAACINQPDINKKTCRVSSSSKTNSWFAYTEATSKVGSAYWTAIFSVTGTLASLFGGSSNYGRRLIHSSIEHAMVGLSSCQKACLVKCATSKTLSFSRDERGQPSGDHTLSSLETLYCDGKGTCMEFSRVAKDISANTSTKADIAIGIGIPPKLNHSYNYFEIDGQIYLGEPQNASCDFYHTPNTLKAYKDEFERQGKNYDGEWLEIFSLPERGEQSEPSPPTLPSEGA